MTYGPRSGPAKLLTSGRKQLLFGLSVLGHERGLLPAELAREAEARGFASLWFADHSHIPVKRETPWGGGPELPDAYKAIMDPLVCMAAAATATTRLRVGTGVALVVERDPIQFGKAIATLDVISGGRVDVGVGGGWNLEEMRNHGTDPATRWRLMRERIEAMKALWTTDPAEYHGQLVDFDPVWCRPKPVQRPHPPIHVGGAAPGAYRRALRYGDGWIPIHGRGDDDYVRHLPVLRQEAEAMGRSLDGFEVTVFASPEDERLLASYREAGIDRVLFAVPPDDRDAALQALDRFAKLTRSI